MNRLQLTQILSLTGDVTKKVAERQLTALIRGIRDALHAGEDVTVTDQFKLFVEQKAARTGRNPATGAAIAIPAKKVIKFKPYKHLTDGLNPQ